MRVAYVLNDAAFFVSHRLPLALSVIKKGGKVFVLTGKNVNLNLEIEAISLLKKYNINHKACMFSQGFTNPIFEIVGLFQLIFFLNYFQPTTIHSVTSKGNFMASIAANFIKKPKLILSVSGLGTMFTGKINFKKKLFIYLYKNILKICLFRLDHKIIFQNNDDFEKFKTIIKINPKIAKFVLGSGVDTNYLIPSKIISNERNILLPARMLYEKGVYEFIEAARILKNRNVKGNFYLAGDDITINPSAVPKEIISAWVREGIVKYLDYEKDMKSLYNKMSIICLPSWREGFPRVLMEAASCGIPVITTDVPGCRNAIIKNKTGLLVPPKNSNALAKAIQTLFEDETLRKKMGKAGRLLAIKKFDLKIIVPQIVKLYI